MSDQRKRGTIYCKQRAPITFKSTSEHVDDARETDSFMCSAITKRSCKRGHTRSVGARDTVRAVRGRRAWSCEAHLRTYAPSLASICFRQRVARSSLLDDPLKWRSAARYTCATFLGLFSRICTVGGYEVGIAQECLDPTTPPPPSHQQQHHPTITPPSLHHHPTTTSNTPPPHHPCSIHA